MRSTTFKEYRGSGVALLVDALAGLRIAVFREFPYLYDGELEYEKRYLRELSESPDSFVAVVKEGSKIVGAATALPLRDADPEFQRPFNDVESYFYFGESVLLAPFRGRGIGHEFFDRREAEARRQGFSKTCFCAVVHAQEHPARPRDYRDLETFWEKRGYRPQAGKTTTFPWLDLGESEETEKVMQFWERRLSL